MSNFWELRIAMRYLFTRQKDRFISIINLFSIIGIALGVATLVVVVSIMIGYEKELINKVLGIRGHLTITHQYDSNNQDFLKTLNNLNIVKQAHSIIEGQAMIIANKRNIGINVRGMNIAELKKKSTISLNNTNYDFKNQNYVILGNILMRSLGLSIGDRVKIITTDTDNSLIGFVPRDKKF